MTHGDVEVYIVLREGYDSLPEECKVLIDPALAQLALLPGGSEQSTYDLGGWDLAYPYTLLRSPPGKMLHWRPKQNRIETANWGHEPDGGKGAPKQKKLVHCA